MGTGWFAADAANVKPAQRLRWSVMARVGLLGVLSAKQMGAKRIIAMSRHASRQKLAREFGATDILTERGDEGVARIVELTNGVGADSSAGVRRNAGVNDAGDQFQPQRWICELCWRSHGVELNGEELFFSHVHLHGGPAPVRRYLPDLIKLVWERKIEPASIRSEAASRSSGGGLPRDGRAPCD